MMARVLLIAVWVAVGHALAAALFWALVNIPESSIPLLVLSGVTALASIFVAGLTPVTALAAAGGTGGWRETAAAGLRRWPAFLLGLAIFLLVWWVTATLFRLHQTFRGELDAWLLLNFEWTRTAWLHTGLRGIVTAIRFPLGIALALGATAAIVLGSWRAGLTFRWLRSALGWRSLVIALVVFVACLWGPWQVVDWRPRGLPPTWVEPVFVGAKLLLLYVWATAGCTWLIVSAARRHRQPPTDLPT